MKNLFTYFCIFICSNVFSQNITNTLGTGGTFTIKYDTTNYFTLSQSTGQVNILNTLRLENSTSSSIGTIFKNTNRFLHNYGTNSTFLGVNAGNFTMVTAYSNTGIGTSSLSGLTSGDSNTAVGHLSLTTNSLGGSNIAIGYKSLMNNLNGNYNTAVGTMSLFSNTSSTANIALGYQSMYNNTTGVENVSMGVQSLYRNTIGNFNTSLGTYTLSYNISGIGNTAVGHSALIGNTASYNTAVGTYSLRGNQSGYTNTAVGYCALAFNQTGHNNTAVGDSALVTNSGGNYNSAFGKNSLKKSTGSNNTAVGDSSLIANTFGFQNTVIGSSTGSTITSGSNLTLIGYNAEPTSATVTNQITLGNASVMSLRCNVTTITSLSDARDKKNIKDLSLGLDFLMKIKPRQFNWDKREWYDENKSDGSKMKETPTAGFIAQELDEAQTNENADWLNLVLKDNPEKLEATYGNLLPVMVKAIQELKVESEKLKVESVQLKSENKKLKENNEKLSSEVELLKSMSERIVKLEMVVEEMNSVMHTSLDRIEEVNLTNNKPIGGEK